MSELDSRIDEIMRGLVRDVAAGVHGLYRGDTRQQTTQLRMSTFAKEAGDRLRSAIRNEFGPVAGEPAGVESSPVGPGAPQRALTDDEVGALTRCVMAWLPLGGNPGTATPELKCLGGAREMAPTWGDRETARHALRRISSADQA